MNSLYGKFGQREFNEIFYVNESTKNEYIHNPLI